MRTILALATTAMLTTAAAAEVPSVVTDIPVVQSLVAQVMGTLGTPAVIVPTGADPHDFQLRPSQARALATADVIVWIGPEMTPWLSPALATSGAAVQIALLDVPGTQVRTYGAADHAAADHAEVGTGHDSHDPDHDHAEDGRDPHAWLDPGNARAWVLAIAEALAAEDPDNAASYRANAARAAQDIAALDTDLATRVKGLTQGIVTGHDAYGYLAAHYGLPILASLSAGDAAAPGAARMTGIRDLIASGRATCVLPEAGHDAKAFVALTEGSNAKIGAPLDPEGIAIAPGAGLYAEVMTTLVGAIADCAR
jgi:zinc transport system substrate-binding protein